MSQGLLSANELSSTPLADVVTIDTNSEPNSFDMNLPLLVTFNGLNLGNEPAEEDRPRVIVHDGDLYDGAFDLDEPFVVLENGDQLLDFQTVSAVGIFSALEGVQNLFGQLQNSAVLQKEIPFTDGATMADVLDLAGAFGTQILERLSLNGSGGDSGASGPSFESVQQMVDLLAANITYVEDDDGDSSTYDPAILLDIDFTHLFEVLQFSFDLGGDFDGLTNISTSA